MFAYYTAARWFGTTLDLVLYMFCVFVALFELYTVKDSSTAGMNAYQSSFILYNQRKFSIP
jgi:hypothetical protein